VMDTMAIIVGLLLGLLSAAGCYGVSMIASGLFSRPIYRLYSRVLIGICCVMLLAPLLRWLSIENPMWGTIALAVAQYVAIAILGYGVYRFNREYLQRVFLRRKTTAYFIFGTLAYATVVTLVFLHVAVSGTPSWAGHGHGYITAAHYGPILVLLAAMVFDTDSRLKAATGEPRKFSRFTFIGYAISFLGIAVSTVPFVSDALNRLSSVAVDYPWVQSISSAEALLIAILLYVWLVWRYESIPPLFMLLLAIIAEYHIVVTQWAVRAAGPAIWGLASLPLFAGIAYLEHYFSRWDAKKRLARERNGIVSDGPADSLRFATPFRLVHWGLAAALLAVTFWTRFFQGDVPAAWLGVTFFAYSGFFLLTSFLRQQPALVYLVGLLGGLAGLLGLVPSGGPLSTVVLASIGLTAGLLSWLGNYRGVKIQWRTPLADVSLVSAMLVIALVFSRHLLGLQPYRFHAVSILDAMALIGAMLACVCCGLQYQSRLPVFGILVAAVTMLPTWSAALGLLATIAASLIERWVAIQPEWRKQERVLLVGRYPLSLSDKLPSLFAAPLSLGGTPLALLGLAISIAHVLHGDFSSSVLLGAATSAVVLLLLTRSYRLAWLYVTGILATYFAIHAAAQGLALADLPAIVAAAAHLAIMSLISLVAWLIASGYANWCGALLKRVAEEKEASIRDSRAFYSSTIFQVTVIIGVLALACGWIVWLGAESSGWILLASSTLAILFALAASVYRSKIGSYLSLTAVTLAALSACGLLALSWLPISTVLAGLSLVAAAASCLSCGVSTDEKAKPADEGFEVFASPPLPATGLSLWLRPLALYALICSPVAVLSVIHADGTWSFINIWTRPAPLTYALASLTLLLSTRVFRIQAIYIASVAFAFAAFYAAAQWLLNERSLDIAPAELHLVVTATLSLLACQLAWLVGGAMHRRELAADNSTKIHLHANREFFAGVLHHIAFASATFALLWLAQVTILDVANSAQWPPLVALTGVVLTATFISSALAYRSRVQTYCALTAFAFTTIGVVDLFADPAVRIAYQVAACSGLALSYGLAAWMLTRTISTRYGTSGDEDSDTRQPPFQGAWQRPPFPLVSLDPTLWSNPLAHGSAILAFLAVLPVANLWGDVVPWLLVTSVFLAGFTWLIATKTYGFGLLGGPGLLDGFDRFAQDSTDPTRTRPVFVFERSLLYFMSILAFAATIHMAVHLIALEGVAPRLALAWHLVVAGGCSLAAWCAATITSLRFHRSCSAEMLNSRDRQDIELYSGLLHHWAFALSVGAFAVAVAMGRPSTLTMVPVVASCVLLAFYFGLAGATYRSQLGSYWSLASLGLGMIQLSALATNEWGDIAATVTAVFALLGLFLMALAAITNRRAQRRVGSASAARLLSTPWAVPPLPLQATSWLSLWFDPLRHAAMIFSVGGLSAVAVHVIGQGGWQNWVSASLVTMVSAAISFLVASRMYNTSVFTYVAAALLAFAGLPFLRVWDAMDARLGVAWSLIALGLWLAGFAIEKAYRMAEFADSEDPVEVAIERLFERPLIRSSAVLSVISICLILISWISPVQTTSLPTLLLVGVVGTLTLLLNARSMNVFHRFFRGRMLVYVACVSMTVCCVTVTMTRWGLDAIGPNVSATALLLSIAGLILMERVRLRASDESDDGNSLLTFADPLAKFGALLAVCATIATVVVALRSITTWTSPASLSDVGAVFDGVDWKPVALTFVIVSAVSFLTVRSSKIRYWLDLAVVLGSSGGLLLAQSFTGWAGDTMACSALMTMNALVFSAHFLKSRPIGLQRWMETSHADPERAFYAWPLAFAAGCLVLQVLYLSTVLTGANRMDNNWPWLIIGLLDAVLFLQVMYLRPHPALLHLLVASTVVSFFGSCLANEWNVTPDVALAVMGFVWGIVAIQFGRPVGNRILAAIHLPLQDSEKELSGRALNAWAAGLTGLAIAVTIPIQRIVRPEFPSLAVSLFFASATCLSIGIRWRNVTSTVVSLVLFPVCLGAAATFLLRSWWFEEYAAIASAGFAFTYVVMEFAIRRRGEAPPPEGNFRQRVCKAIIVLANLFAVAAVVVTVVSIVIVSPTPMFAVVLTLTSLTWFWMAWESGREPMVYASMCTFFGAVLYLSTVLLGFEIGRSVTGAFAVIGYSYGLYVVNILVSRAENPRAAVFVNPTYFMALLSPVALALILPLDQKGTGALTLLAAGSFYLIVSHRTQARWSIYVAAALFNMAIYLWVPVAKDFTGLSQLYVIPAAITVLIFAQLHRHDLKPRALNGIRAAAAGTILAVSTFEVFFARDAGLFQFVAVLLFSLAGTAAGIALRIRPFLTIGVAFLVINVLAQLGLQFQHETGVIRAVILITVGLVVIAMMIFFNIHRERILSRYRGFLADEKWD
jgi:hypothetical protein